MRRGRTVGCMVAVTLSIGLTTTGASLQEKPRCAEGGTARQARDHHDLPASEVKSLMADLERRIPGSAVREALVVPVRFHVITDKDRGQITRQQVDVQIDTLNATYGGARGGVDTGVRFSLVDVDVTVNPHWFTAPAVYENAFKKALHGGGSSTLNLYSAAVGEEILGYSTFPQWQRTKPLQDGVVVDYRSLSGGPNAHFNLGFTAVHEIGHWLGLFHTFENGCEPPGDGIADTPYEAQPTEGCPGPKDTCPDEGFDPVHNYMDYAWDDCMLEFTQGQAARIHRNWQAYRTASPL